MSITARSSSAFPSLVLVLNAHFWIVLQQDSLANEIIERVDNSPYGVKGRHRSVESSGSGATARGRSSQSQSRPTGSQSPSGPKQDDHQHDDGNTDTTNQGKNADGSLQSTQYANPVFSFMCKILCIYFGSVQPLKRVAGRSFRSLIQSRAFSRSRHRWPTR